MKKIRISGTDIEQLLQEIRTTLETATVPIEKITKDLNPTIILKDEEKAIITFEPEAYKKMHALVKVCEKEIGWHGVVVRDPENPKHFHITDILVFPQNVTGSTVTPDQEEFNQWTQQLMMGDDPVLNRMRFHGHSHVNMATSPSGVDTTFQKDLMSGVLDFYIFGIFNKRDDYWMAIYDIENNILYERADIKYIIPEEDELAWAKTQIDKYVKEAVTYPKAASAYAGTYGGFNNGYNKNKANGSQYNINDYRGYSGYGGYGVYDEDDDDAWYQGYCAKKKEEEKAKEEVSGTKPTMPAKGELSRTDQWRDVLDRGMGGYTTKGVS